MDRLLSFILSVLCLPFSLFFGLDEQKQKALGYTQSQAVVRAYRGSYGARPWTPGIFPPGPPSSLGVGGAGAPGQGWGRGPTPKGLALDLGWPPLGWLAGRAWGVLEIWWKSVYNLGRMDDRRFLLQIQVARDCRT